MQQRIFAIQAEGVAEPDTNAEEGASNDCLQKEVE